VGWAVVGWVAAGFSAGMTLASLVVLLHPLKRSAASDTAKVMRFMLFL
jgi:hypothetical protein